MASQPSREPRLDVLLALRRAVQVSWLDFAALLFAGVVLVTLPGALTRQLPDTADWATFTTTLRGVC